MTSREIHCTLISVLSLVLLIAGCAAHPSGDEIKAERYFQEGVEARTQSKKKPPYLGLALAGGGTKAGDFSIGVLQGLTEAGIMDSVDAISTVSGGGYAALWYFARLLNKAENPYEDARPLTQKEIAETYFSDCLPDLYESILRFSVKANPEYRYYGICPPGNTNFTNKGFDVDPVRYQNYLRGYQDVMGWIQPFDYRQTTGDHVINGIEIAGLSLATVGASAIQFVPNVVFDWEIPLSPSRSQYRAGILQTFGATPPNCAKDHTACEHKERRSGDEEWTRSQLTFSLLREKYEKGVIPLWIINATAGEDRVPWNWHQKDFSLTSFEFSPYGSGSNLFKYSTQSAGDLLPWEAVMASAAFLDSQQRVFNPKLNSVANVVMRGFALDWGTSIRNDRTSWWNNAFHKVLPWPFYLFHGRAGDSADDHANIRLSDGGQSENLGAYALIQRNLPNIILSDHSVDRGGLMGDLCRLKKGLGNDSTGHNDSLYLFVPGLEGLNSVCSEEDLGYDIFNWEHPILLGCVTSNANDTNCSHVDDHEKGHFQRVFIIKPALPNHNSQHEIGHVLSKKTLKKTRELCTKNPLGDELCAKQLREVCFQRPAGAPYTVAMLEAADKDNPWPYESLISCELFGFMIFNALTNDGTKKLDACPYFPQSSTVDTTTNSSPTLYGAYRELGRYYARQLGWFFGQPDGMQRVDTYTMDKRYHTALAYQVKHAIKPNRVRKSGGKAGKFGDCLLPE